MPRTGRSVDTESRSAAASPRRGERRWPLSAAGLLVRGMPALWDQIEVTVAPLCGDLKALCITHFKRVNFMACDFYLNLKKEATQGAVVGQRPHPPLWLNKYQSGFRFWCFWNRGAGAGLAQLLEGMRVSGVGYVPSLVTSDSRKVRARTACLPQLLRFTDGETEAQRGTRTPRGAHPRPAACALSPAIAVGGWPRLPLCLWVPRMGLLETQSRDSEA